MSDKYEALTTRVSVMRTVASSCQDITRLRDEASRQWEAHLRSRPVEAAKSPRALQEKTLPRGSRAGHDPRRLPRAGDHPGAAGADPHGPRRQRRGDGALRSSSRRTGFERLRPREGRRDPCHRLRQGGLVERGRRSAVRNPAHSASGPARVRRVVRKELTERVRQRQRAKEGDDLVRRIEALEQRLSLEGINGALHALAHRVNNGKPQAGYINQRFRDYELAIVSIKQLGNELGQRLARERLSKPVSRPAPANLKSKLCTQADIESDWSAFWRQEIKWAPVYHRKLWELTYVAEVLYAAGKLKPGRQGRGVRLRRRAAPEPVRQIRREHHGHRPAPGQCRRAELGHIGSARQQPREDPAARHLPRSIGSRANRPPVRGYERHTQGHGRRSTISAGASARSSTSGASPRGSRSSSTRCGR